MPVKTNKKQQATTRKQKRKYTPREKTQYLPEFISIKNLAELLGIHWQTAYIWVKEGRIASVPIANRKLIPISEIERLKTEAAKARKK